MDKMNQIKEKRNKLFIIKYKNSNLIHSIIIYLILFSFFQCNLCESFTYPTSLNLITGNILIIHQNGIDVYDSTLENLVKSVKTFSNDEKISDQNTLTKVSVSTTGESEKNIFISIIINKIYIFNYKGELLYEESNTNIINLFTNCCYDLTPIKINGNKYIYSIGFVNGSNQGCLYFFEYDKDNNSNTLINSLDPFKITISNNNYDILQKDLACDVMSHSEKGDILVCFLGFNNGGQQITTKFIDLNNYQNIDIENKYLTFTDIKAIKSAITSDGKKCLICVSTSNSDSYCTIYTIEDNTFTTQINYGVACRDAYFSPNLVYIKQTNQFIFSCSSNNGDITAQIFDENFSPVGTSQTIVKGTNVAGTSIVYSYDLGNYYVISDITPENDSYSKFNSFPSGTITSIFVEKFEISPTVISTTIPTTILTTIPTTILTTIPTTISTTIPTTILIQTPPTTVPKVSEITSEEIPYTCNLQKCLVCNEESFFKKLCIQCNTEKNFYQISPLINYNSLANYNGYIDCYNNKTKPSNFYFNKKTSYYEPCYKTCAACEYGGDGIQNNCTKCDVDLMFDPEKEGSTNCVAICTYYYYISYGQYKCTTLPQCPDESNLLIREKRKCIDSCSKDSNYSYQYNGECIEKCPADTIQDETEHLCKVINIDNCTQSSATFELYDFLKEGGVEKIAKNYASEFNYTNKHISLLKNEIYSIMLYKEKECISELKLPMPEIDFGDCYKKVQSDNGLENKKLIIGIIDKKSSKKKSNPITSYAFYNPDNGDKLNSEESCKEKVIVVQENIKSLLNESSSNIDSILFLAGQNIDIFNISSEFYTNICYHFDSPCDKDVSLRDRLLVYYPNITLCDLGCRVIGVNLTSMMSICECKFKEISDEDSEEEVILYKEVISTFNKILNQVNLDVMKCYKDLFEYKFFISNTGGMIFLALIFIQITTLGVYYFSSLFIISKYIYNITENFLLYLNNSPMVNNKILNFQNNNENNNDNANNSKQNINFPPKKDNSIKTDKSDKVQSNKLSHHNKKGKAIEDISIKMLSSGQLKKPKKLLHKVKSYSNKNMIKKNLSINSENHSGSGGSLTFKDYLTTDIEDMNFHDVALSDKRLFFDYFCDKLRKKQLILQIFCAHSPLKPLTIKLLHLILDIEICFVLNAMFINENYVSKIFHLTKKETFISFIPRSLYRIFYTIIDSVVVNYFIKCLFVEESKIKGVLKREKSNVTNLKYEINIIIKEVKIRNNIFIIIAFVYSIYSWFYISCFNNIYPHMKIEWVKSSVLIIVLIHVLSIFVILIETLLRFVSFEIKSERMYRASVWLG